MLQSMATRRDVDVVTYSRGMFPTRYFRFGQQPIDAEFDRSPGIGRLNEPLVKGTARKLKAGEIGAIYTHRMSSGRARSVHVQFLQIRRDAKPTIC